MDYSSLGSILGYPYFGKLPHRSLENLSFNMGLYVGYMQGVGNISGARVQGFTSFFFGREGQGSGFHPELSV